MAKNEEPEHVYTSIYSRLCKCYFTDNRVPFDGEKPKRKRKRKVKIDKEPSTPHAS